VPSIRRNAALLATAALLAFSAALSGPLGAQSAPSADALAARVQERYDTVRDFTADFTLAQSGGLVMRGAFDRGTVAIRKPGYMRWVFTTGSKNEVVSNGVQIYSYFPQDKYVQIQPMPKDDTAPSGLLLLSGRGKITRDFTPALPADQPQGEWRLLLTPKVKQQDFKTLALVVDRASLQLRGLEVADTQGSLQTFRFTNLRENQGVKDSVFQFAIPKGVVIR
jgi:outer membrane lipoprotein carrier protein